ncbi:transporter substrate-binding domain-containing protein [Parasphingopyxis algicola]|uniref:transporter substrate-binding domain-containing protein n=1 Tax=Parasphingopyxis algicola TaxID=2026624 RepID=UPI0015A25BDA|nr:transporter substrate-binding domain-containing protein [Parasphingopyxis algicola]QLC25223.1 transporter substrate-binding domain-containing protein [Parasphingopyxis algicola]
MTKLLSRLLLILTLVVPAAASAEDFATIRERGEIVVGVSAFAPWTYRDNDGELAGHEIDLANRIAADLGVAARFELFEFDRVFAALERGDVDMVAAGVAISPERAQRFYFSNPYMQSGINLAVNMQAVSADSGVGELDTPETTIAVVEDSLAEGVANRTFEQASVTSFPTPEAAEAEVLSGRAQAYVASVPETRIFALRFSQTIALPLDEPLVGTVAGFVVRSGEDSLLHFLNAWIHIREADGFLEDRYRHYFHTLDWAVGLAR